MFIMHRKKGAITDLFSIGPWFLTPLRLKKKKSTTIKAVSTASKIGLPTAAVNQQEDLSQPSTAKHKLLEIPLHGMK